MWHSVVEHYLEERVQWRIWCGLYIRSDLMFCCNLIEVTIGAGFQPLHNNFRAALMLTAFIIREEEVSSCSSHVIVQNISFQLLKNMARR